MAGRDRQRNTTTRRVTEEESEGGEQHVDVPANADDEDSTSPQPSDSRNDSDRSTAAMTDAQARALIRRQQVRRAQIQHRQRRANYVRELEQGVVQVRGDIESTAQEVAGLQVENAALRTRLGFLPPTMPQYIDDSGHTFQAPADPALSYTTPAVFPGTAAVPSHPHQPFDGSQQPGTTVQWGFDDSMQVPRFQLTSAPPASTYSARAMDWTPPQAPDAGFDFGQPSQMPDMTAEQTQAAIDFILALEHPCWSHFSFDNFKPAGPVGENAKEGGHAMMASSIALRDAPEPVFARLDAAKGILDVKLTQTSAPWYKRLRGKQPVSQQPGPSSEAERPSDFSWQAPGLTIATLHGLACSLAAPDMEITPVQAFFELAKRYPTSTLLQDEVCESLRKEFVGVVRCVQYGSAIERGAFESVVGRILGQATRETGLQESMGDIP